MNAIHQLLTDYIDIWTAADTEKKSGRGRSSGNAASVYGIRKLRELILELAVRGKLVPQDANDEPASELLKRIQAEKAKLIAEGKIKNTKPLSPVSEGEKLFDLPQGWEWTRLGSIGISSTGRTPSTQNSTLYDGSIPFIGPGQITLTYVLLPAEKWISEAGRNETTIAKMGDILMVCIGGSIGKSAIADKEMAFNQQINCISPFCVESKFAHISMMANSFQSKILEFATGSATPIINKSKWEELLVPVSPLAEQHRIVAKVDELMTLCDQLETQHSNAAEAHEKLVNHLLGTLTQSPNTVSPLCKRGGGGDLDWQRIAAHFNTLFTTEASIDALKQTLLQLAVMGKLVPQDPNDEPASELLKRIQAEKAKLVAEGKIKKAKLLPPITNEEKPFDLPQSWEWIRVAEVAELITSGSRDWAQYLSDAGAKFVTMGNLSRGSYELRLGNMRYVNPPKDGEGSRTKLEANDLLISITGDVGNLGRIPEDFGEAYINQHTCLLRFISQCQNRYFPEIMRSPMAALQFNAPQRGIKNSFRLGDLEAMVIPLPPLAEQHRIVAKVDELMAICDQLKSRITEANQLQQKLADALVEQALS